MNSLPFILNVHELSVMSLEAVNFDIAIKKRRRRQMVEAEAEKRDETEDLFREVMKLN